MEQHRCGCGQALEQWRADRGTAWAASPGDVAAYKAGKPTRHDVLNGRGRTVQVGECAFSGRQRRPADGGAGLQRTEIV